MKEQIEHIVDKIEDFANSEEALCGEKTFDHRKVLSTQRRINYKITLLYEIRAKAGIEKDVEYIKDQFIQYKRFVGNHINNTKYLAESEIELGKFLSNIENRCEKLKVKLYE